MNQSNKRIRQLTPRECFRLMGVSDTNIDTLQASGISNSQLYKLAGNSIVVDVLAAIFGNMLTNDYSLIGTKKADTKSAKSSSLLHQRKDPKCNYEDCKSISSGALMGTIPTLIDTAKVTNNSLSAKNAIRKFFNGDFMTERKSTLWATLMYNLKKILTLSFKGQGAYNYYMTDNGKVVDFRLDNHNCNPENFKNRGADLNISVYVALFELPFANSNVEYREYRCSKEDFDANPEAVKLAIIKGFSEMLRTGVFVDKSGYFKEVKYNSGLHGIGTIELISHKLIKRYIALHGKAYTAKCKERARRLSSDLCQAITTHRIRQTDTIATIEKSLLSLLTHRANKSRRIEIFNIEHYRQLVG